MDLLKGRDLTLYNKMYLEYQVMIISELVLMWLLKIAFFYCILDSFR